MPYSVGSTNLPENVKAMPARRQRQWIAVWNNVYSETGDESRAFASANAVAKMVETIIIQKFNPYHDKSGHFASGGYGGTGGKLQPTQRRYMETTPTGYQYNASRSALHDQIISQMLDHVPSKDHPTVYLMGGGPAAGKSSILTKGKTTVPGKHEAVYVNADDVKEGLPEYKQGLKEHNPGAAAMVHSESSDVAKMGLNAAMAKHTDVVLDGTGNTSFHRLQAKVENMHKLGYKVEANYVTLPISDAVARMQERGKATGRYVPSRVVAALHTSVSRIIPQALAKGIFDKMTVWDNNVERGADPVKVASYENGKLTIHNKSRWNALLERGGYATR